MYVVANPRRRGEGLGFVSLAAAAKIVGAVAGAGAGARRATRLSKDLAEARARMAGGENGPDADYLRAAAAAGGNLTRYEYDIKRKAAGDVNLYSPQPAPSSPFAQVAQAAGALPVWLPIAAVAGVGLLLFARRRRR